MNEEVTVIDTCLHRDIRRHGLKLHGKKKGWLQRQGARRGDDQFRFETQAWDFDVSQLPFPPRICLTVEFVCIKRLLAVSAILSM